VALDQAPIEALPGPAVAVVEQQPVAAAPVQGVAANAERGPYLARRRKLAAKHADVVPILPAVELDRVQVEPCRDIADGLRRRIAQ